MQLRQVFICLHQYPPQDLCLFEARLLVKSQRSGRYYDQDKSEYAQAYRFYLRFYDILNLNLKSTTNIQQVLRRSNAQMKQFRKGIKESGIWPLITERPDVVPHRFPRESEVELTPQVSFKLNDYYKYMHVSWNNIVFPLSR